MQQPICLIIISEDLSYGTMRRWTWHFAVCCLPTPTSMLRYDNCVSSRAQHSALLGGLSAQTRDARKTWTWLSPATVVEAMTPPVRVLFALSSARRFTDQSWYHGIAKLERSRKKTCADWCNSTDCNISVWGFQEDPLQVPDCEQDLQSCVSTKGFNPSNHGP